MRYFIVLTFLALFGIFWQMSGGADFVPEERPAGPPPAIVARAEPVPLVAAPEPAPAIEIPQADIAAALEAAMPAPEPVPPPSLAEAAEPPILLDDNPLILGDEADRTTAALDALRPAELMYVAGSVVNMREGPGTDFSVVARLPEGTVTEVIERSDSGWIHVRVQGASTQGWMSADFLAPLNG